MDKIIIKDLEVYAYHGVNEEEKTMGQKFLISAELSLDLRTAGKSDDLTKTVNYANLCHDLEKEFTKEKFDLIEHAAQMLCEYILINYELVSGVKLLLKKPWAPIGKSVNYAAVELEREWHTAYVALGSNMGDKQKNIDNAISKIKELNINRIINTSKFYETEPVGFKEQDNFLNGVIELKTLMTPLELIHFLLGIEKDLKRVRDIPMGPRTIDLDILLYDDIITSDEEVIIPHPRMHERTFVLLPLNDIAPYKMHPILNKRMKELLEDLYM